MTPFARTALLPLAGLAVGPTLSEEVVYAPEEDLVLVRSFSSEADYDLDELVIELDGEEMPHGEAPELSILSSESIVVTDELLEVEDGRPVRLRRTYDELSRSTVYSSPSQEEDFEEITVCDLEESSVLFQWDADEEQYLASDEDDIFESDVLDDLEEDMDLRQLLPNGEVDPGDSWEVPVDAYARLMWPSGYLHFHAEDGEYDEEEGETDRQMVENLAGEGEVTFVELQDGDDGPLAVLEIRFEVTSSSTRDLETDNGAAERTLNMSRDVSGTVLWSLEAGYMVSAQVTAEAELEVVESGQITMQDGEERELAQTRAFSGTIEYAIEVEAQG